MKNLDGALRVLARVRGRVEFAIYGPIEDRTYWATCQNLIRALPPNVTAFYHGPVDHSRVATTLAANDLLFVPTRGENFGHAILEALAAGCPVLISDRTRWRDLEASGAGWDIPLTDDERMVGVLNRCVEMDEEVHSKMSEAAARVARAVLMNGAAVDRNRELFEEALRESRGKSR
jgi:glycosyltransferase involved in cell wall biosynthesis